MEKINTFFSRLFRPKTSPAETESPEIEESKPHSPVQHPTEDQPAGPVRHCLELPDSHAIYDLCALYREQTGRSARPELYLEGPDDPCLPDQEGEAELHRIRAPLTSSANKRLKQASPRKAAGEEQPSIPDLDTQAEVFLSKNNLTAWILAYPPSGGGKHLDRETLTGALAKHKITFGINEALLDAIPKDPKPYFKLYPIARGQSPVPGEDGQILDQFPRTQDRQMVADENDRVDYANLGLIHNVEEGGEICRIILPTPGVPGRTVQDREVPAKDGKPAAVPKGKNTQISEDGQSLTATMSGHVEFSGGCFHVKPVMDIPGNVDFSVGNISFFGDVCIRGDVCSGFTVRATGSITIDGVVEASTIEAGRNLVIVKGVQGDSEAVLRAQGSVFAKYIENCCVYAKQDVETEAIINCEVYSGGTVNACSGHGKIIGGKICAGQMVHAGMIGSRVGNRTDVILGGQPCEDFDYTRLTNEIRDLEEQLKRIELRPKSPDRDNKLGKLRMQLTLNKSKLNSIEKARELQPPEPDPTAGRVMKCSTVNPGTVLTIGNVVYQFDDTYTPCLARVVDGEMRLI